MKLRQGQKGAAFVISQFFHFFFVCSMIKYRGEENGQKNFNQF